MIIESSSYMLNKGSSVTQCLFNKILLASFSVQTHPVWLPEFESSDWSFLVYSEFLSAPACHTSVFFMAQFFSIFFLVVFLVDNDYKLSLVDFGLHLVCFYVAHLVRATLPTKLVFKSRKCLISSSRNSVFLIYLHIVLEFIWLCWIALAWWGANSRRRLILVLLIVYIIAFNALEVDYWCCIAHANSVTNLLWFSIMGFQELTMNHQTWRQDLWLSAIFLVWDGLVVQPFETLVE